MCDENFDVSPENGRASLNVNTPFVVTFYDPVLRKETGDARATEVGPSSGATLGLNHGPQRREAFFTFVTSTST